MMKKVLALFLLVLFTASCSDVNEDVIPDPVVPEIQIDNQQSSGEGDSGAKPPRS